MADVFSSVETLSSKSFREIPSDEIDDPISTTLWSILLISIVIPFCPITRSSDSPSSWVMDVFLTYSVSIFANSWSRLFPSLSYTEDEVVTYDIWLPHLSSGFRIMIFFAMLVTFPLKYELKRK